MPRILVVDGNPDHQRSLGGLIRHRTSSTLAMVTSSVDGARAAVRDRPDVILVNVLLYLEGGFALRRVLDSREDTRGIPMLVHYSGVLEDLTRRRIEASGASGLVELPASADELVGLIDRAMRGPQSGGAPAADATGGVKAVHWPQAKSAGGGSETAAPNGRAVRPVDWSTVAASPRIEPTAGSRAPVGDVRAQESPPRLQKPPTADGQAGGFRTSSFQTVDPSEVKGAAKGQFQETAWPSVDPKDARRKGRRGR